MTATGEIRPDPFSLARAELARRPMTALEKQLFDDLGWAATAPEVQRHAGKLVVVHKKKVVAVGEDQGLLLAQAAAEEKCLPEELVIEVVPGDSLDEAPR